MGEAVDVNSVQGWHLCIIQFWNSRVSPNKTNVVLIVASLVALVPAHQKIKSLLTKLNSNLGLIINSYNKNLGKKCLNFKKNLIMVKLSAATIIQSLGPWSNISEIQIKTANHIIIIIAYH